ncbi:MAG: acyltransferase family protein [Rhizobiales bacterium]|nr:acyltransferase family protein [Hyphomicrobiales bacterium]
MVVMMHSTLGVEAAAERVGWMHVLVEFAKPFRMPDFFLISGLFLARVIDRDWRTYADRKVVHFAYFYALWVTIQFAFKAPGIAADAGIAEVVRQFALAAIEPFGTLWFIYLLPIFFVVAKVARTWRIHPAIVWLIAAGLEIAPIHTGWTMPDEFAARFVYFYTGYVMAPLIFRLAAKAQEKPGRTWVWLVLWAMANGILVLRGVAGLPFVSLALGLIGAVAVVRVSALLAQRSFWAPLRYCGEHSIVIYLAFFLFMAASRTVLIKSGLIADVGTMSLIVTAAGVIGPLMLFWLVRGTWFRFLFERPAMFWLTPKKRDALQPAE